MPLDEAVRVQWRFNDLAAPYPDAICIHDLVGVQAAYKSSCIAIEWEGCALTYAGLKACARKTATGLHAHGAATDSRIALQLHRSLEMMVGLLGVLYAGCAYLPLDPMWQL